MFKDIFRARFSPAGVIIMLVLATVKYTPKKVETLTAQIDVAPTILGILQLHYRSRFFGQDVLHGSPGQQRAFISTYQGFGLLQHGQLIIQSPVKQVQEYTPDFKTGDARQNWLFLVLSGLATGLSWIFYFKALQAGKVSQVAPVDKLSVALTIVLSVIFLGEVITWKTAIGAGCIIIGTLVLIL